MIGTKLSESTYVSLGLVALLIGSTAWAVQKAAQVDQIKADHSQTQEDVKALRSIIFVQYNDISQRLARIEGALGIPAKQPKPWGK